jgi:uncharacterized protein YndB with AHSA1/START domain
MSRDDIWAVELEYRVTGSPDEVFEYFTDPEKYRRWKGQAAELDARPGGVYRVQMTPQVWVSGRYVTVDRPRRLVMTWGFQSEDISLPRGLSQVPPGSSAVEFTFRSDGGSTIVGLRHVGLPSEEARGAHTLGWETYLSRLATLLAGRDPGDDPAISLTGALFEREG